MATIERVPNHHPNGEDRIDIHRNGIVVLNIPYSHEVFAALKEPEVIILIDQMYDSGLSEGRKRGAYSARSALREALQEYI